MPFLDEIAAKLAAAGVGTVGVNIFLGSGAVIPPLPAAGPFMSITETGGSAPLRIQNVTGAHVQRPTAQIMVRAASYSAARAMAKAAYDALDGIWNTTLSGTFYQKITARQEPTDIGLEEGTTRRMIAFNIEAQKQPS
jgi:hypothetical protein